jgi:hypothetical protein
MYPLNDSFSLCVVWEGDYDFLAITVALSSGARTFLARRFGLIAFHASDSVEA